MKLTKIRVDNEEHIARVVGERVYDLNITGKLEDYMEPEKLKKLENIEGKPVEDPEYVNLTEPKKIICVGWNYPKHAQGFKLDPPEYPVLFSKYSDALIPNNAVISVYPYDVSFDYETELVIVIGRDGFNIPKDKAFEHVFGYAVGNDVTCRKAQFQTSQWLVGKAWPNSGPCGPCVVTADEFDPSDKSLKTYVNGELRQDGNTGEMMFKVDDIIAYASRYLPLSKGDLIFTGTPEGVAHEKKTGYLKDGDKIDSVIEGIGTLHNEFHIIEE